MVVMVVEQQELELRVKEITEDKPVQDHIVAAAEVAEQVLLAQVVEEEVNQENLVAQVDLEQILILAGYLQFLQK